MTFTKRNYSNYFLIQIVFYIFLSVGTVFLHTHELEISSTIEVKQSTGNSCFYAHQGSNQLGAKSVTLAPVEVITDEMIQLNQEYFDTETVGFSSNRAPPIA